MYCVPINKLVEYLHKLIRGELIMGTVTNRDKRLYNSDLAPTPDNKKNWGWFEIFNVWANDVQSLFGYTLAA